jgi:hypothetical protein
VAAALLSTQSPSVRRVLLVVIGLYPLSRPAMVSHRNLY